MAHRTLFLRLSRPTSCEEAEGSPKFLTLLSLHATLSDPGSPSGISPLRFLRAGFRHVKTVANCIVAIYGAESPRGCTSPLRPAMFSVYASQLLFAYQLGSFSRATLDTGCWLGFARQGLSPYKKRQAALGALTPWPYAFAIPDTNESKRVWRRIRGGGDPSRCYPPSLCVRHPVLGRASVWWFFPFRLPI